MHPQAGQNVVDFHVRAFNDVPEPIHLAPNFSQFGLDGFQLIALFSRDAVHLFIEQPDQFANVALGEDVIP